MVHVEIVRSLFVAAVIVFLPVWVGADYTGNVFDPKTGSIVYLRLYFPTNQDCIQVNFMNHVCWTTVVAPPDILLLEDGTKFLLEDGTNLLLEQ